MKEREKCKKKRAITDFNAPNGSRDIPFQSQEFGQYGHRHFVGFQPHFHLNMTSQTQCCTTMKKMKVQYLSSLLFVLFENLQAFRTQQRILAWFQISLLWQPKSKLLFVIEKTKGLLFKQEWCSKSSLKQYSLTVTAGSVKFWRNIGDKLFLLWENNSLLFLNKG